MQLFVEGNLTQAVPMREELLISKISVDKCNLLASGLFCQ
jgi:hypothetical protein